MKKYKNTRTSVFSELKSYCPLSHDDDFIEVTEWSNTEGFDVAIDSKRVERFSLTWGEFEALKKLVNEL